jgi:hypothetical protein
MKKPMDRGLLVEMAVDSFIKINFCNKIVSYFSREIVRYKEVLRLIEINA